MPRTILPLIAVLSLTVSVTAQEPSGEQRTEQTKNDLALFRDYLAKTHKGKRWKIGPGPFDSPEVRQAYPMHRLYFVSSPQPMFGDLNQLSFFGRNATPVEAQRQREIRVAEQKECISVRVRIGSDGKVVPINGPADCNEGLMKVENGDDACIAAAAILSFQETTYFSPRRISAKEVGANRDEFGWSCNWDYYLGGLSSHMAGFVRIDAKGKCTAISLSYTGPFGP